MAAAIGLLASGAHAQQCISDMKAIDDALAKRPRLTDAQMAEVMKYRSSGEALYKQGKQKECADTFAKAKQALSIK